MVIGIRSRRTGASVALGLAAAGLASPAAAHWGHIEAVGGHDHIGLALAAAALAAAAAAAVVATIRAKSAQPDADEEADAEAPSEPAADDAAAEGAKA